MFSRLQTSIHSMLLGETIKSSVDEERAIDYLIPDVLKVEADFPEVREVTMAML